VASLLTCKADRDEWHLKAKQKQSKSKANKRQEIKAKLHEHSQALSLPCTLIVTSDTRSKQNKAELNKITRALASVLTTRYHLLAIRL
jgi:hypothetical protein